VLLEEDISLRKYTLNFAQGERSPFDCVKFYTPPYFERADLIDRRSVSLITPSIFQEHVMRLFVRDPKKLVAAERAFSKFSRETLGADIRKSKEQVGGGRASGMSQNVLIE